MRRRYGPLVVVLAASVGLTSGCVTTGTATDPGGRGLFEIPPTSAVAPRPTGLSPYNATTVEPVVHVEAPPPIRPVDAEVHAAPTSPVSAPVSVTPPASPPAEAVAPSDKPLVCSLRELLDNRPSKALESLAPYDKRDQELLIALLALAARVGEGNAHSGACDAPALDEARRQLAAALKARAPLSLGAVCFCSEVKAFGVYKPVPVERAKDQSGEPIPRYQPGEPMKLYIEVRDFLSQAHDGYFETRLAATVTFKNECGQPVMPPINLAAFADRSLTARQDYFIVLTIPVPPDLPQGRYTLWLEVRDETPSPDGAAVPRSARSSLDFHVIERGGLSAEARARRSPPSPQ